MTGLNTTMPAADQKTARKRAAYARGLGAEDTAERMYRRRGCDTLARRSKSRTGELDLVVEGPDGLVFVEVKARKTLADAAWSVTERQTRRIMARAIEWLAETGRSLDQAMRFDVVLVDQHLNTQVIENAFTS